MTKLHLAVSDSGSWCHSCWLSVKMSWFNGALGQKRGVVNVICSACSMTNSMSKCLLWKGVLTKEGKKKDKVAVRLEGKYQCLGFSLSCDIAENYSERCIQSNWYLKCDLTLLCTQHVTISSIMSIPVCNTSSLPQVHLTSPQEEEGWEPVTSLASEYHSLTSFNH